MTVSNSRIAIIGSGISGLTAGYLLSRRHEVTLFEANDYIGGHTHTVAVDLPGTAAGSSLNVDTGFIVCNDRNYPNFLKLMRQVEVELQATQMSFSVRNPVSGLEYNGHNLDSLFAQRRNLISPSFWLFVRDILRFNKAAKQQLNTSNPEHLTLNEFLNQLSLGDMLKDNYLLPMVAAIWSCSIKQAGEFPLAFFLRFFLNHGLLDVKNRPQWYVLKGGSHSYIQPLTERFGDRLYLNSPVSKVHRTDSGIEVEVNGTVEKFDQVVIACHSDQALALLERPTPLETEILSAIEYQPNEVILHTDSAVMPVNKKAWASWNFIAKVKENHELPVVTYCMNILQGIGSIHDPDPLLVTLNASELINPQKILQRFSYAHPVYSTASSQAQSRRQHLNGTDGVHFCGAYWYNGFHEDGVRSALDVCQRFGEAL